MRTLSLLGLCVLFLGCQSKPQEESSPFPETTNSRVQLFEEELGIELRVTECWPGTEIPKNSTIDYKSGVSGYESYREDGTLQSLVENYPLAEGEARPKPRLQIVFESDGRGYRMERFYREDGSLKFDGRQRPDRKYTFKEYYPDGTTVKTEKLKSSSPGGSLLAKEDFNANGVIVKSYRLTSNVTEETTLYWEDGVIRQSTESNFTNSYRDVHRIIYDRSGQLFCRIRFTSLSLEVAYPTEQGFEVRSYARYGGLDVTYLDSDKKPTYRQHWTSDPSSKDWTKLGDSKLTKVTVFDNESKEKEVYTIRDEKGEPVDNHGCPQKLLSPLTQRPKPKMLEQMPLEEEHACGEACSMTWQLPAPYGAQFKYSWW